MLTFDRVMLMAFTFLLNSYKVVFRSCLVFISTFVLQ